MSRAFWQESVNLLACAISFAAAPGEAEEECCRMARLGLVEIVMTEDIDALAFGAPLCLRGITTSTPTLVVLDRVLSGLGLSGPQFIDMCILCGSDFTPKAKGIGPVKALDAMKKYGSIEEFLGRGKSAFPTWSDELFEEFKSTAPEAHTKFLLNWNLASSSNA